MVLYDGGLQGDDAGKARRSPACFASCHAGLRMGWVVVASAVVLLTRLCCGGVVGEGSTCLQVAAVLLHTWFRLLCC